MKLIEDHFRVLGDKRDETLEVSFIGQWHDLVE